MDTKITEAIELLDNLIGLYEDNHNSDYDGALKMGINALKVIAKLSFYEKDEDLISNNITDYMIRDFLKEYNFFPREEREGVKK